VTLLLSLKNIFDEVQGQGFVLICACGTSLDEACSCHMHAPNRQTDTEKHNSKSTCRKTQCMKQSSVVNTNLVG